jgi:hypothetical protein
LGCSDHGAWGVSVYGRQLLAGIPAFTDTRRSEKTGEAGIRTFTCVLAIVLSATAWYALLHARPDAQTAQAAATRGALVRTSHYAITSTATRSQTMLVANAAESLYTGYMTFFAGSIRAVPDRPQLRLTLYKDQQEFKQRNKSALWAEAYYLAPTCHAYFAANEANPYHWMLHEATHQLNHEVAQFPQSKWINEGLATYFGTSAIRDGKLIPGHIDVNTYPIWGVVRLSLSGDLQNDIRREKIIGLRALISGIGGPNIDEKFNAYYIGYWSLTHFLFHFEDGRYAQSYRRLIASGGTIDDFERVIGPVHRIENEWYAYLMQQVATLKTKRNR